MSWVTDPLSLDPATGETVLPGPVTVELAETTIYLHVPPNTYFFYANGTRYTMVQVRLSYISSLVILSLSHREGQEATTTFYSP
jgi:hypothetical protein